MINPEIINNLPQILEILKNNHVRRAYLFGSVLTDHFNDKSDLDIIVDIDNTIDISTYGNSYWNIMFGLEDALKRKIDLITECSIKNPYFKIEVDNAKVAIL
jgi:hypothetical protein